MVTAGKNTETTKVVPEKENVEGNNPSYDDEGNVVKEETTNLVTVKDIGLVPDYQANNVPSVGNDGPYLDEIQSTEYRKFQDLREKQAKDQVASLKKAVKNAEVPNTSETDTEKMKRLRAEEREKQTVEVLQTIEAQKDSNDGNSGDAGANSGAGSK